MPTHSSSSRRYHAPTPLLRRAPGRRKQIRRPFPCFPLVGNHDIRQSVAAALPRVLNDGNGFVQGRLDLGDASLLMLDTLDEGRNGGLYCAQRQAFPWVAALLP